MTRAEFKNRSKRIGRQVYSCRKIKNSNGWGYNIVFAAIISANSVSSQRNIVFWEKSLLDIILEWEA